MNRIEIVEKDINISKNSSQKHISNETKTGLNNKKYMKYTSPLSNKSWKEYRIEIVKNRVNVPVVKTEPSDEINYREEGIMMNALHYEKDETLDFEDAKIREIDLDGIGVTPDEIFKDDKKMSNYKNLLLTPKTISKIMKITKELVDTPDKGNIRVKSKYELDKERFTQRFNTKSKKFINGEKSDPRRSNSEKRRITIDTSNLKVKKINLIFLGIH